MDERVRLQRDMEQAKKDGDFDDFHRKELDEIEIDDIKGTLSGWQGRSVSSKADGVNYEDDRGDFDEIFASIHKQLPNYQQQAVRDNCLDQIIWNSLNLQTRQLFTGKSFNHLSQYVLKSDPWISLNLLNSLLDLPDARTEKGKGWYLGVVSDASDPVEEDYLRLYIGQSIQIARRVQHHLRDRYTQESFQYQTTRRSDKRVQYVTLGVIPTEGLEHETQRVLLNYGELLLCLFFQTLPQMQLPRYLPQEAIREPWIGLNCQNPMQQGIHGGLIQGPDSAWASKDVPETVRAKRQENMSTIHYLHNVMGKREAWGTYTWARDADLRYGDDPSVLVQCGRCRGRPRLDRAPLYARDGSGYILRLGRCNDCRSLGKEITRLPRFYPIDPRVPYIQMSRLKAEYMRSHPELKVADIECEDGEVFTNEELDEAKQVYRESLDEELEDIYLQNANWQDEEQEDVVQEAAGWERRGSYGTGEFGGDFRERLLTNQSVHCHKTTTGLRKPRIWVRELHITLPDTADVHEEIRVWCDLRPEGSEHPQACAINTEYGDPARRLGIQVTYFDVNTKSKELIWCHVSGEKNTKKLNSLVDFLLGETEDYTESQPRRFLARNKARGISRSEYTS